MSGDAMQEQDQRERYTGWATENVAEPTPEEIDALRELMRPTRPLKVTVAGYIPSYTWTNTSGVYTPDGDAVTTTSVEGECE